MIGSSLDGHFGSAPERLPSWSCRTRRFAAKAVQHHSFVLMLEDEIEVSFDAVDPFAEAGIRPFDAVDQRDLICSKIRATQPPRAPPLVAAG